MAILTASLQASSTLSAIDARIEERHLLKHPFYQAWTAGELSLDELRDYASQYYHHVAAFPRYLSAVHSQTDDLPTRRHILNNLLDEEAGSPNHPELWMNFAEHLGLAREQVESAEPWPETRALIGSFRKLCGENAAAVGLSALYAYESQVPAVSESKIQGLRKFYGFAGPEGYRYFTVHIEADREHSRIERELLANCVTPQNSPACLDAVNEALTRLWNFLSVARRWSALRN